jgi:hypothetical protein
MYSTREPEAISCTKHPTVSKSYVQVTCDNFSSESFWRRHLEGQRGGVEPKVIIPLPMWARHRLRRRVVQIGKSHKSAKREIHLQFKSRAVYGLHPASNKQNRYLPIWLASTFLCFVQNKYRMFILNDRNSTWIGAKEGTTQKGGYITKADAILLVDHLPFSFLIRHKLELSNKWSNTKGVCLFHACKIIRNVTYRCRNMNTRIWFVFIHRPK